VPARLTAAGATGNSGRLWHGGGRAGQRDFACAHTHAGSPFATYPWTTLQASGQAVGLPDGQVGNSEVGHLNIGAGRVVYQELTRINRAIQDGSLDAKSGACRGD